MIDYTIENPFEIKEEMLPLVEKHYEEDHRRKLNPVDVNWVAYDLMFANEQMTSVVARDNGRLIGYITVIFIPDFHSMYNKVAVMDSLFVHEDYRGKGVASSLLDTVEKNLVEANVDIMSATFRDDESAQATVGKKGFSRVEVVYSKSLKGDK